MDQIVCPACQFFPACTNEPVDPKQVEVSYTCNPKEDGWKKVVMQLQNALHTCWVCPECAYKIMHATSGTSIGYTKEKNEQTTV